MIQLVKQLERNKTSNTVWKLQDLTITQILCEINYGESRSSKTTTFALLGALNFVGLVNFTFQKVQKIHKIKIQNL